MGAKHIWSFATAIATAILLALVCAPVRAATVRAQQSSSGPLIFYSAQGYDSAMAKAFQKMSGIKVLLTDGATGNLLAKIAAERNNPQWDVVWFDGDAAMQGLDEQKQLARWTPANAKNYNALGRSLIPSDHAFYPTAVTAAGALVYNSKRLSAAQVPKDWSDLLKPQFRNQVAAIDPAYSGPAFSLIAGMMQRLGGEAKGKAFFRALKANGMKVFQTSDSVMNAVQTGARLVGFAQDSGYYGAKATGAPLGIVYPRSGVTLLPGVVAINAKSKHRAAAEAFVNFILSPAGQNVMLHDPNDPDSNVVPVIKGITALQGRQVTGISWQRLDYKWAAAHENAIKSWYHDSIVQ